MYIYNKYKVNFQVQKKYKPYTIAAHIAVVCTWSSNRMTVYD